MVIILALLTTFILIGVIALSGAFIYGMINPNSTAGKAFNNIPQGEWFTPQSYLFEDNGEPFEEYKRLLSDYLTVNTPSQPEYSTKEIVELNLPYLLNPHPEQCSRAPKMAAMMIHGLYSSPAMMRDMAEHLANNCVQVRSILLPGHGTKPGDLTAVEASTILNQVSVRTHEFISATPDTARFLIAHSYGGLLSALLASRYQSDIHGMVLYSPAFFISKRAPLSARLGDHLFTYIPNNDFGRLSPVAYLTQSVHSAKVLFEHLDMLSATKKIDTPTKLVISEHDEVTQADGVLSYARKKLSNLETTILTNDPNRAQKKYGSRFSYALSASPESKIVSMSHLGYFVKPDNPLYTGKGPMACIDPRNFSCDDIPEDHVFGGLAGIPSHATISKLAFNPFFDRDMDELVAFIAKTTQKHFGISDAPAEQAPPPPSASEQIKQVFGSTTPENSPRQPE